MNIVQAKDEIKRTVEVYLEKDRYGDYVIPYHKQRPVYMVGAPGIGKTAIMEQIAQELDIALVSYSMSHHTRQSALGLPYIVEKNYGGETLQVSNYTLSEIIAKVYDTMEKSHKKEGILFLDEINCVSETLAPAMLQFLQYKVFGNRPMPPGWIIVTAGNPVQYNKSVREFDIATKDRLRCLEVEEDFDAWRGYAAERQIHGAIMGFLETNREYFYRIRTTSSGKVFVTARGWEDLSLVIRLYEKKGFRVDSVLASQYVTDPEVSRKFAIFYDLYLKYNKDYHVEDILAGSPPEDVMARAKEAPFDERIAILEMIFDRLGQDIVNDLMEEGILATTVQELRKVRDAVKESNTASIHELLLQAVQRLEEQKEEKKAANNLSQDQLTTLRGTMDGLRGYASDAGIIQLERAEQFPALKKKFQNRVKHHNSSIDASKKRMENVFRFVEKAWGANQEMTLIMTFLTGNRFSNTFINRWGCDSYFKYNQDMLIYDAKQNLLNQLENMDLDDESKEGSGKDDGAV